MDNRGVNKWLRPREMVRGLHELNCEELVARGIRGVMLDLDNTLAPWASTDIAEGVEAWVGRMRAAGLRGCLVTNAGRMKRVQPVADRLGLPSIIRAVKPLPGGFRRGMELMQTTPETTAMIGDMLLTDILGANRLGLYTVLVEPISPREFWSARWIQRPVERWLGRALEIKWLNG